MPLAQPRRAPSPFAHPERPGLAAEKFADPAVTADGSPRARVTLRAIETLWFNTGTLCNLACANCYIESTPRNDALAYLTAAEVAAVLDEVANAGLPTRTIGFTGGEPFLNRDLVAMLGDALARGHDALVLTNAMRPMRRCEAALLDLRSRYGDRLALRVSLDHHTPTVHEAERGPATWEPALEGLLWLARQGFRLAVAGRRFAEETEAQARAGYAGLFAAHGIGLDAADPAALVLFPEMEADVDVPEITDACWSLLGIAPDAPMCASSRMVVKRRGAARPHVVSCTLIPYDLRFDLGPSLSDAPTEVALNHPHCARFCVLGGASCG